MLCGRRGLGSCFYAGNGNLIGGVALARRADGIFFKDDERAGLLRLGLGFGFVGDVESSTSAAEATATSSALASSALASSALASSALASYAAGYAQVLYRQHQVGHGIDFHFQRGIGAIYGSDQQHFFVNHIGQVLQAGLLEHEIQSGTQGNVAQSHRDFRVRTNRHFVKRRVVEHDRDVIFIL